MYKHKLSSLFRKVKFNTEILKYLNLFKENTNKIFHTRRQLKQVFKFINWITGWTFLVWLEGWCNSNHFDFGSIINISIDLITIAQLIQFSLLHYTRFVPDSFIRNIQGPILVYGLFASSPVRKEHDSNFVQLCTHTGLTVRRFYSLMFSWL